MKSSIVLFLLSMHILPIFAEESRDLLTLSFPIFDSGNDELMVGYGDWCPPLEGPHPGIDFFADETDDVLNPFDAVMIVLGSSYDASDPGKGCILGIGLIDEWWGWALKHLKHSGAPEIWCMNHPRGMNYASREPIEECIEYTGAPRHLHIDWSFWEEDLLWPGGARIPEGFHEFINPFDYFNESQLANYDQVLFKRVLHEGYFNTGAWFMPDGTETPEQISGAQGNPDYAKFQNIVSGAIDIAISPYSSLVDYPDNVSAGVSAVGYMVLYQNPITLGWESTASSEGNWGFRELFHSEGQTPWNENDEWDTDEYRASFADGNLTGGGGTQLMTLFQSAYIVTNSGALDTSSWTTGWDNVWTEPYLNDWTTGICQGAWDTNLQLPPNTGDAQTNADAFFPDGRYAVEVTALSHGSREMGIGIDTLPVNDLSLDPSIEGVVVDNFLPHIQGVAVYAKKFGTYQLIYEGYWEDEPLDEAISGESEYLEYLRENLHTLQSEDLSTALPSFCVIDLTESSNQSILNQIGFSESARTSEEYSDVMSTLEPGCCFDEGFGQNAVEFLMEENARVENRRFLIDFDNTTRVLTDTTYGYLTNNTERLIIQVFYSEPIMLENSNGQTITDMLKFEGIIGSETEWRSSDYGQFGRLPGSFQLPLPTYDTVSSYSESEVAWIVKTEKGVV